MKKCHFLILTVLLFLAVIVCASCDVTKVCGTSGDIDEALPHYQQK